MSKTVPGLKEARLHMGGPRKKKAELAPALQNGVIYRVKCSTLLREVQSDFWVFESWFFRIEKKNLRRSEGV